MGHGIAVRPTLVLFVLIMGTDVLLVCVQEFLREADYKMVHVHLYVEQQLTGAR